MKYIAAAVTAIALSAPVQAAVHIYEFTASVDMLANTRQLAFEQNSVGVAPGTMISLGDRIVGRFSYDSGSVASSVDSSTYMPYVSYNYGAAPSPSNFFNFTILPSGQSESTDRAWSPWRSLSMHDGKAAGSMPLDTLSIGAASSLDNRFEVTFVDLAGTWFTGGKLPEQLSLADISYATVSQDYNSAWGERILLRANMTSLTNLSVTAVPEPGTWAMLVAGLGILGLSARRKRA